VQLVLSGAEHAILVTGHPEITFEAFATYAASFGGILRAATPALEANLSQFQPDWNFNTEIQTWTRLQAFGPGTIVWRLQIDCTDVTTWPPYPEDVPEEWEKARPVSRVWGWWKRVTSRR
jgi:hypothetical protein